MSDRVYLRIGRGQLTPADELSAQKLRGRGYSIGDMVSADLRKPRNPRFHRLAHQFGQMLVDNIEAFAGLDAHGVLKRLQIEGNIGCDEIALNFPGLGPCSYRVPRSLSFDSMDEAEFQRVYAAMCDRVREAYWPELETAAIEEIAPLMGDAG